MSFDFKSLPVEEFLPHAGKMVLIDEVIVCDKGHIEVKTSVRKDSLFYDAELGGSNAMLGIEWMAQSIGTIAGIHAKQNNEPVRVGFLLGTRRYEPSKQVFELDSEYIVKADELYNEDNGLAAFECGIYQNGVTIAESTLSVFSPKELSEVIQEP